MLRFTQSPTANINIDHLRIAILNYLVSQQRNKQFLIRIEDINNKQDIEGKDTEIMMILEKFALKHNSVFHQSEHLNLYMTLALRLLKEKKAFICKCDNKNSAIDKCSASCETLKEEEYTTIKESGEKFVIRIKEPKENKHNLTSFIIINEEGIPSHDFACATDDMMSNINTIIDGDNNILKSDKYEYIKTLLGYENKTEYISLPSIVSDSEISITQLFEEGYIPDAILNYLVLIGNHDAPKEIFTLPDSIKWFKIENLNNEILNFNMEKLRFINREHLKLMDDKKLSTLFGFADAEIGKLAKVYLQECSTINELEKKIHAIFTPKDFTIDCGDEMRILEKLIEEAPDFKTFNELTQYLTKKSEIKEEKLYKSLRYLLTNTGNGPELNEIYPFIKSYILEVAS